MIVQEQSNKALKKLAEEILRLNGDATRLLDAPWRSHNSTTSSVIEPVRETTSQEVYLRSIYNAMACGVVVYDASLHIVEANKTAQEILGLDLEHLQTYLAAPQQPIFKAADGHTLSEDEWPSRVVFRTGQPLRNMLMNMTRTDGQRRWLQADAVPLVEEEEANSRVVVSFIDVTERIDAEQQARDYAQRLQTIINNLPMMLFAFDQTGIITFLDGRGVEALGLKRTKLIATSIFDLCRNVPAALEMLSRVLAGESFTTNLEAPGHVFDAHFIPLQDENKAITGAICVAMDVTKQVQAQAERAKAEEATHYQALHDMLTGLPNRTLLHKELEDALAVTQREGQSMALLMMDLDHFKEINDTFGHDFGDQLLQQVGERIRQVTHTADTLARLGGDEFALLLPLSDERRAREVATTLCTAFEKPFMLDGYPLHIKSSMGIVSSPTHGCDPLTLLRRVEVAMYAAKEAHEAYMVYDAEQDQNSFKRLALLGALRNAIASDELVLYYQPKVDLRTGAIRGVEALARWRHPEYGFVPPVQFIPLAEQTGLIVPLTHKVLEMAIQQCSEWQRKGINLHVSVNLSMWNLREPGLAEMIAALLTRYHIEPRSLCVEITESAVMSDIECTIDILQRLFDLGVRIAIDDFGTGYSSLAYLQRLPIDELKIDRSFVQHMASLRADASIVRATVNMAHSLGIYVVAEGVEDLPTWKLLESFTCDTIQGYYLARPLPVQEFEQWLSKRGRASGQPQGSAPSHITTPASTRAII